MGGTTSNMSTPIDGRRARRERGRLAVIDAMFSLLQDGKMPVTAELVAERFEPLLAVDPDAQTLDGRITAFVTSRVNLYEQAGTIMAVGRLRALEHEPLVAASAEMRGLLAAQVRSVFGPDVGTTGAATDVVAVIDALTSLESWDVMRKTHSRSRRQIEQAWRRGISAVITEWAQPDEGGDR
jgi:TetR/AcrR family transcriptional regulator, regulator of autoinduction and epiphytic fitness